MPVPSAVSGKLGSFWWLTCVKQGKDGGASEHPRYAEEVMSVYATDNSYPIYGFGAKIPPTHSAP